MAGEELDAPAGTLVFVSDPATRRAATAAEPNTTLLVVGGTVGKAFQPSPWESWLEALPFYESKDFDAAVGVLERALAAHPDNPNVLYNLACCEALAGRREDARAHIARAVELDPRMRTWAADDADLESVRDANLGGCVSAGRCGDHQPRLLGRLQPGRLRWPESRTRAVRERTECRLAKIAVFAGDLLLFRHRSGSSILRPLSVDGKRCRDEKHAISARFRRTVD